MKVTAEYSPVRDCDIWQLVLEAKDSHRRLVGGPRFLTDRLRVPCMECTEVTCESRAFLHDRV